MPCFHHSKLKYKESIYFNDLLPFILISQKSAFLLQDLEIFIFFGH